MRELLVCTRETGEQEIRRYTYSILIDEMDVGPFSCESYGIRVRESPGGAEAAVPHVTTSIACIDSLLELLTRNAVSPDGLRKAVGEWMGRII